MLKDHFYRWTALFSLFTIASLPLQGYESSYRSRNNEEEQKVWWLVGAAALGAAAGAGTAAAISSKGKKGDRGPRGPIGKTGPEGSSPFVKDPGSLTFTFSQNEFTKTNETFYHPDFIYTFVSTPDGHVYVSESLEAAGFHPKITVSNCVYGTYNYGYVLKEEAFNITTATSVVTSMPYFLTEVDIVYNGSGRDTTQDGKNGCITRESFGFGNCYNNTWNTQTVFIPSNQSSDFQVTGQFTFSPPNTTPVSIP